VCGAIIWPVASALLNHFYERKLAKCEPGTRIVTFTARGEKKIAAMISQAGS